MALSIDTSYLSYMISGNLNNIVDNLTTSLERLSSGLRINSSSDDPAGLAKSELMRASIATYDQAQANANDAVSLIQTAEGSLDIIDEKLTRMKELAEQSSTGTYTASQRTIMQSEFALMGAEIDRIAGSTSYNGIKLLDGSLDSSSTWTSSGGWTEPDGGIRIQVDDGASRAEDYYYITIPDTTSSSLFNNQTVAISTQTAASNALDVINTAIINKENARSWLGALENRLEGTIDNLEAKTLALESAESNIMNADIAAEMTQYIKNTVLLQAATAILAQANVFPSLALDLIEGLN